MEVRIPWHFRDAKREPPEMWCHEPWMRTGAEWHNSASLGLCWVVDPQWRDAMNWRGKGERQVIEEGCRWLLAHATSLINRHYEAHLTGRERWNPAWDAWPHNIEGFQAYEREKRKQRQAGG